VERPKRGSTQDPNDEQLLNVLKVNRVPHSEKQLEQMPSIYGKFVEDKII